jgi:SAM-dependent methyltransferase
LQVIPKHGWKSRLAALRDFSVATNAGFLGKLINRFMPARPDLSSLAQVPLHKEMRILDVGCGSGSLLNFLQRAGFESLAGIDPFLPDDIQISPNVFVRKLSLGQVQEHFDLIMFHHVFEHVESGQETLRLCRERLSDHGKILLRFPTADSDAWEYYRENWVQLDAPRHFFLHTRSSFELLAKKADLKIEKWFCDSTSFQFWGSELYQRNQPLFGGDGVAILPETYFSKMEMKSFAQRTREANAHKRGDQIGVVLSHGST